jgi:uncharacterized protein
MNTRLAPRRTSLVAFLALLTSALLTSVVVFAEPAATQPTTQPVTTPTTNPATGPAMDLVKKTFVLVVQGDNPPVLSPEASRELQAKHLAHINAMGQTGKVLVAGPFGDRDDPKQRGLLIFDCPIDEARAMAEQDPAVKAGRLKVVCMSWYFERGDVEFPKAQAK